MWDDLPLSAGGGASSRTFASTSEHAANRREARLRRREAKNERHEAHELLRRRAAVQTAGAWARRAAEGAAADAHSIARDAAEIGEAFEETARRSAEERIAADPSFVPSSHLTENTLERAMGLRV